MRSTPLQPNTSSPISTASEFQPVDPPRNIQRKLRHKIKFLFDAPNVTCLVGGCIKRRCLLAIVLMRQSNSFIQDPKGLQVLQSHRRLVYPGSIYPLIKGRTGELRYDRHKMKGGG